VADPAEVRGGVVRARPAPPARKVTLLQRKAGKLGKGLGKTTGWIHRAALLMKNVEMIAASITSGSRPRGSSSATGNSARTGN